MSKAYVVTIGQKPCNVTEIGRPVLVCRPEKPDENGNLDITYPVVVSFLERHLSNMYG